MQTTRWSALRQRIHRIQEEQRERIRSLREGQLARNLAESVGELSSLDQHTSDLGNETMERSKDIGQIAHAEFILSACEEALARMAAGTYGICERCGRTIPEERLAALPYTSLCVDCSAELSEAHANHRPVEEEAIGLPFRAHSGFGVHDVGIDRDDTWEIVARHGTANTPQDTPEGFDPDGDGEVKGNG